MKPARSWSEHDIGALDGHTAVVTGANSGVGFETARHLAAHGALVVLACRDPHRGRQAATRITEAEPGCAVRTEVLNLADLHSIRRFAQTWTEGQQGTDILVNNAGVSGGPRRRTVDGFEMHFGTNHLGHFALTGLLLPALLARPGARVVTVTSSVAAQGRIDFADLQSERRYGFVAAYARSKLANLMFARELDRRAKAAGANLLSIASHPGVATSDLLRDKGNDWGRRRSPVEFAFASLQRLLSQSASDGAWPALYAATATDLHGGEYIGPSRRNHTRGVPSPMDPPGRAIDEETSRRLWDTSIELTGVAFDPFASTLNP